MKVKEESEEVGLKLNIQKTKIMASGPISSVQFSSVAQLCPTLCDPMNHSMPGLPVHHQLPEFTSPISSWQIEEETIETGTDFIFLGSKITEDHDCSHEIKRRRSLLGRKVMTNLGSILKSRDITLPTKVCLVKTGFSNSHVWMWELDDKESWAPKNWCFLNCGAEDSWESLGEQGD